MITIFPLTRLAAGVKRGCKETQVCELSLQLDAQLNKNNRVVGLVREFRSGDLFRSIHTSLEPCFNSGLDTTIGQAVEATARGRFIC